MTAVDVAHRDGDGHHGASLIGSYMLMPPALSSLGQPQPRGVFLRRLQPGSAGSGARVESNIRPFWGVDIPRGTPEYDQAWADLPQVPTINYMTGQPGDPVAADS
jgi:hypothetical protein